ncbi:hypothetical protein CYMTET_7880 [Cymbomonas tetramitiformis]|uniref:AAA+ ATPase domain-containing protein n=1 Tax=Cymbomonas tetramitiformis TaxID=36881 RepID=A0AAE0GUS5_9CHLO|nr:hypothetical protein CYMTET_7880 [Cymbomonas tetramitiformis]
MHLWGLRGFDQGTGVSDRFHSAAQSFGGTALLELHLSQVQLSQVHLPAHALSSQWASAAVNVTVGAAKAVLVGSYGTLVKGLGQVVSAGIDTASQQLSHTCFAQLKDLSEPPADDVKLEEWLQERHDEHFQCGEEGQWEPKGEGRWEPKAAFSVVLADLVAARPPRLTPQLLEMVCLGGEDFIGLTNLMALGSHSAADVDARHTGLVNLTMWAQEVVLQTLEQSETSPDAPDPSDDGYGLQVLAEELERVIREGTAMLASSAERLTAAVAEAVSEQVRVVLVSGARDAAVRGKPKAVAALAACNSVLDGVEESLRGVDAAAAACLPLLQLTSKLLRALSMPFPDAIVESVIDRALHELDQAECSVETRLQKRLADALSAESFVNELRVVLTASQSSGPASTSAVESQQAARPAAPSDKVAEPSPRDAVKDSLTRLLSEVAVAELRPTLGALQAFLGLIKRPASEDAHGGARRELMQLAIELDAEVACVAQNEVERCMENEERCADEDVAVRGRHEAEALVGRLPESLARAVKEWLVPALKRIRQKLEPSAGESSKTLSLPPGLIDAIAYVDAGMATLAQVSECAAACEHLLRAHVRPPLGKAHARVSGEARGRSSGWAPSLFAGRKKRPQASDGDAAEDPEQIWPDLQRALGGLDRILRQIAGTEPAASWTEEGREAWEEGVMPTVLQAACGGAPLVALQSSGEGTPSSHETHQLASKGTVQVTAAFLQLSIHLKQTRALAGSLQTASKGLNLRALAQAQAAVVAKDSLVAGGKGLMETVKDRVREMTVKTQEQLAEWVDRCTGDLGDVATSALGDTCGALLAPALGLLGEVVKGRTNKLTTHTWQVREVAMLGALRALDALRHAAAALHDDAAAAGGSARADVQANVRAVRKELQAAVLVRLSLERTPSVQALQRQGEALAAELNVPLRAVCDLGAQGGDGDALLANQLKDVGGTLEELRKAMEGERESRAKREREEERERLAAIERHEAWAQAEHVVRKTIDAQLLELEEAQKAVALEPDLLQKQLLLVRCRGVHAALAQSSRNVNDIGTGIGVVVGFLTTVNDKLDVVNGSLNALQSSVRELGADLRRMVGQPVLEALAEQRSKRLAQCQELRREVYIATDGVGPGDDGKFLVSESNEPKDLLKAVKTELLESKEVSLLLLSGPAGSGKSTFVRHLEVYLEMEYVEQTRGERGELVLVKVSLPTLKNPMADLFREALARGYGLREAQIHELRDLARAGTVRLIFLLDAYDELPSQCLFKNLYMSNNLEQYRAHVEGDTPPAYPKVIITTRTELLSRAAEYRHAFVPMEMDKPARATVEKADASFLELRITPFGSKVDAYIHAKVALDVRRELERQVGALAPLSKDAAEALRAGAGALWRHDALKEGFGGDLLDAACAAVTAPGGRSESLERVTRYMRQVPHDLRLLPSWPVVWVLAGALAETPLGLEQTLKGFCEGLARAETGKIWLHRDYRDAFDAIPELKELTTTPFMVEIVMEILPKLEETRSTDASIKAKLMLLLEDDAVQMVWGCISRWCGLSDSVLLQVQAALEGGSDQAPGQGLENLKKLEEEVVQMLKGQDILLNQPKLVELGWEQLRATGLVSGPMRRRGVGSDGSTAAPDASMDALAGPAAEADWILDEAVEEVIQEEEGRLLEGTICKVGILYLLKNALCRRKVRASRIYAMFARMYVQREARKAVTQGAYDADTVEREGAQYAQRLALTMVAENVTKVPLRSDSELFHEESIWDPFLQDGGELRETVQKAAPVRCEGGMLTFIHKTELMARHGDAPQPVGAATQGGVKGSKEWAQVDLRHEDVVRDFLVDLFLEDVEFISEAAFVVAWAERGGTLLHAAAADGDYFAVSKILEMLSTGLADGALLEQRDDEGRTPLFCAVQIGHAQVAAALLAAGARRDARSKLRPEDRPPVWYAAQWGHLEVMRVLIEAGADLSVVDESGASVAHLAAAGGFVEVLLELEMQVHVAIVLGAERDAVSMTMKIISADLSHADNDGNTPAHRAAMVGEADSLRVLHELGVDLSHADNEGRTPVEAGAARALLEAGAGVNAGTGQRPLHAAAGRGTVEMVRELVEKSAEVDAEDGEGRTALTVALAFGQEAAARALLEAGAGVNAGKGQWPLIHTAAEKGMEEVVRELAAKGAEVDAEDGEGRTALTVALAFGQEAAARALLEAGAGVNAGTGQRPLHGAGVGGMVDFVRELLEAGAEVDAEDKGGLCALDLFLINLVKSAMLTVLYGPAVGKLDGGPLVFPSDFQTFGCTFAYKAPSKRVYYELVILRSPVNTQFGFVDASFELSSARQRPLHAAAGRGTVEMVRELVEKSAEVDAEDGEGRTALTVALAFGQEAAARALLEAGAGVNAGKGQWPLIHTAAEKGMEEVVRELAAKGAEVDAEDGEGRTALTVALAFGQEAVARALLEAGAGVNAGTGRRPLHGAGVGGMVDFVRELLEAGAEVDAEDKGGLCALDLFLINLVKSAMLTVLYGPAVGKLDGGPLVFPSDFQTFGCTFAYKAPSKRVYYELVILRSPVNTQFGFVDASFELSSARQRPLHAAAGRGTVEMVRELVEKSAEVDAEDGEGRTALTVALAFGQEAAARALMEAGAGVNAGTGRLPLHAAARKGMVEMEAVARALLEAGAGVNAGTGRRPLHGAGVGGMVDFVRELLEAGAEVDAEDKGGLCALDLFLINLQDRAGKWRQIDADGSEPDVAETGNHEQQRTTGKRRRTPPSGDVLGVGEDERGVDVQLMLGGDTDADLEVNRMQNPGLFYFRGGYDNDFTIFVGGTVVGKMLALSERGALKAGDVLHFVLRGAVLEVALNDSPFEEALAELPSGVVPLVQLNDGGQMLELCFSAEILQLVQK